jgi:ATP-dependent exoDNAse (exonuclease V) alpha subunit
VLVIDEAGMVGTRQLAHLLTHAHHAGAKVVLVGDIHQLPEIEAGGLFRSLAQRLGAIQLQENRRQRQPWEQQALDLLRTGNAVAASWSPPAPVVSVTGSSGTGGQPRSDPANARRS